MRVVDDNDGCGPTVADCCGETDKDTSSGEGEISRHVDGFCGGLSTNAEDLEALTAVHLLRGEGEPLPLRWPLDRKHLLKKREARIHHYLLALRQQREHIKPQRNFHLVLATCYMISRSQLHVS